MFLKKFLNAIILKVFSLLKVMILDWFRVFQGFFSDEGYPVQIESNIEPIHNVAQAILTSRFLKFILHTSTLPATRHLARTPG